MTELAWWPDSWGQVTDGNDLCLSTPIGKSYSEGILRSPLNPINEYNLSTPFQPLYRPHLTQREPETTLKR